MKKTEKNTDMFREMSNEELIRTGGGSFAYDFGRFLRYMGIYIYEGTGVRGTVCATTDFVANMVVNNQ